MKSGVFFFLFVIKANNGAGGWSDVNGRETGPAVFPLTVVTMSLTSLLLAASATDEVRRENEALSTELEAAQREHKKLRQVVEQLSRDYDDAKELDPLRRYQRLKVSFSQY